MRTFFVWLIAITAVLWGLAIVRAVVPRVPALVRRTKRALKPGRPRWSMSLLVRLDENGRCVHPSVQIAGDPIPRCARIVYRVTCDSMRYARVGGVRLPPSARGTELSLPSFVTVGDERPDDLVRGRWEITVSAHGRTLRRWTVWPAPTGRVNNEAEIV